MEQAHPQNRLENQLSQPWRIVAYGEEDAPPRYALLRGQRRVAWGLRDEAAAMRWLRRLTLPTQVEVSFDGAATASAGQAG